MILDFDKLNTKAAIGSIVILISQTTGKSIDEICDQPYKQTIADAELCLAQFAKGGMKS